MFKVIKIGGNIVDNPDKLDKFLADFAELKGKKILVHGGGKVATALSQTLGIETLMLEGRRVTDAETLKIITMVYAGVINKTIVSKLQTAGCNAVGLSGADGKFITSRKRPANPIDYGFVGDPVAINTTLVGDLTAKGYNIVAAPITFDDQIGSLMNTNADTVASSIAIGLAEAGHEVELVFCFEKPGVLADIDDENSVIANIHMVNYPELKEKGIVVKGMIPKLESAFEAINRGVKNVVICSAEMISREGYGGTTLSK